MEAVFPIAFIGILALAGIFIYLGWKAEKKRREAISAWARSKGYRFSAGKDHGYDERYGYIDALQGGSNRYAYNIVEGEEAGRRFSLFDYHYETHSTDSKGNRQTHHHHISCCVIHCGVRFPSELRVRPEGFFDKLASLVGFNDVDFESAEFSKRYLVKSKDRKFAYDVIHQGMMEYLLKHRGTSFEMERDTLSINRGKRYKAMEMDGVIAFANSLVDQLPDYLMDDLKRRN